MPKIFVVVLTSFNENNINNKQQKLLSDAPSSSRTKKSNLILSIEFSILFKELSRTLKLAHQVSYLLKECSELRHEMAFKANSNFMIDLNEEKGAKRRKKRRTTIQEILSFNDGDIFNLDLLLVSSGVSLYQLIVTHKN